MKRLPTLRVRVDSARPASTQPAPTPAVSLPTGRPEERDIVILLLQGRLESVHILKLEEDVFTIPVYRHIMTQALKFRDADGQIDLEGVRGALGDDSAYDMVVAKLSVWDLYQDDLHAHVIGCLRILGNNRLKYRLDELIKQVKVAEREGRDDDVDILNLQIHEIRNQKAGLMVS
jgi:hypothetical protein